MNDAETRDRLVRAAEMEETMVQLIIGASEVDKLTESLPEDSRNMVRENLDQILSDSRRHSGMVRKVIEQLDGRTS